MDISPDQTRGELSVLHAAYREAAEVAAAVEGHEDSKMVAAVLAEMIRRKRKYLEALKGGIGDKD